jgi:tetratricopeptide (TPR) repeat protein/predicted Ser/Thr protein kinase
MSTEPSWHSLESLVDALLPLSADAREAALVELERARGDTLARKLRAWLAGIERSDGFLEAGDPTEPATGADVGPWRLVRLLGRGGMGQVWLAERADGAFDKQVAIKFIRGNSARLRERFAQERRILARLEHAHIARLLDGGVDAADRPYLVTEYIDGLPLDRWCEQRGADLATRLALFRQIGAAVAYAHANLVVHRDLKSGNVLVDADGRAKLLDFGIARLIEREGDGGETAEHALTPECAAPEQITGGSITTRTDIYALGALLYRLLSGQAPLDTQHLPLAELVRRICTEVPMPPSVVATRHIPAALAADLDAIALRALAKAPEDRYATVDSMLADLDNAAASRPVVARQAGLGYRVRRFLRRNRVAVGAAAAFVAVLLLGAIGTLWQARVAVRERDSALHLAERSDAARDFLVRMLSESQGDAPLHPREMIARASATLERDPSMRADVAAMMTSVVGELELERRDYAQAEHTFKRLVDSAGTHPDEIAIDAMCQLGATQIAQDKLDEARHWLEAGVAHARGLEGSQRVTLARCLSYAGMRSRDPADLPQSLALSREAVDVIDHLGGRYASRQSALHNNYANVLAFAGHPREAIVEFRRALALLVDAGRSHSTDHSTALGNLASALADAGLVHEADAAYAQAIASRREVSGESVGLAQQEISHASVLLELGRARDALKLVDEAEAILRAHADPPGLRSAQLHLRRATAYAELGQRADAEREYDQTEALYATVLSPRSKARANVPLGRAELWMHHPADVGDFERAAAEIAAATPSGSSASARALRDTAELALLRGDAAAAEVPARAARTRDASDLDPQAWQLAFDDALLGETLRRLGRPDEARTQLSGAAQRLDATLGAEHWRSMQARAWLQQIDPTPGHDAARK